MLAPGINTLTFTPTQTGRLHYSCSMGMYSGTIDVIPGGPCRTPVTIRCGDTTSTIPCYRHEPAARQCGACRAEAQKELLHHPLVSRIVRRAAPMRRRPRGRD